MAILKHIASKNADYGEAQPVFDFSILRIHKETAA